MTQEIIKFLTAGNVDDGKSTLIGRMLHDTNSLYQDQIDEVKKSTENNFDGDLDFSLFLDGLISERKQKITIDAAYRYFTFKEKKFVIADAPGHEQYTRNMAVAAANSGTIIILIDALKGVKEQTIRHSYIANLFGIKNVIVAVNKMDLVNFDEDVFKKIKKEYSQKTSELEFDQIDFVPISAFLGENITEPSKKINWYNGESIIDYLLKIKIANGNDLSSRLLIQNLVKHDSKRIYQGILSGKSLQKGQEIISYPGRKAAKISKIFHSNKEVENAENGNSIGVILDREIDLDRGSIISNLERPPEFSNKLKASIIWFSEEKFRPEDKFTIKINHNYLQAAISNVNEIIDVNDLSKSLDDKEISLNKIANVTLELSQKTALDIFKDNEKSGSFLLIDRDDNQTLACGVVTQILSESKNQQNQKEEFLSELSGLVQKYFGNKNINFSI